MLLYLVQFMNAIFLFIITMKEKEEFANRCIALGKFLEQVPYRAISNPKISLLDCTQGLGGEWPVI